VVTRKLPEGLKRLLRRRNAIESMIGHRKNVGPSRGNWLTGRLGDAMHALLCGAAHILRLILVHLQVLLLALFGAYTLGE
jgi:IS5 family transposase